ncbi:hypothetical protein PbJCM13498_30900 [Prolixibacter bellariivorans]|uniref:Type II secretion system protein GspC N-terminal domain-containing protein n=1 Tax=Prolixibacter bellariivorans TaxID=314319 RepID=A0A5M4B3G3_9BACT|nr:hypothetical protein [Prolixibacter bellariivorans]GET34227.1 hypothetical protein PbJCM13498_30900 [Prolixibacter bellariivorans]
MLKNKKLVYLLLPLVLLIWGLIFYRIYTNLHGKQVNSSFRKQVTKEIDVSDNEEKPKLSLNYPDPFLKSASGGTVKTKASHQRSDVRSQPINWPMITYRGMVRSEKLKAKVMGFLRVGTKDLLVHKGDVAHELTVLRIVKDSIQLENREKKRWFRVREK